MLNFLILMGPPGCGKGTVCTRLQQDLGYVHISTGDLLREEAKTNPEIRETLSRGEYISDDIITDLLLKNLKDQKKTVLLDGYPRTLKQVKLVEDKFGKPVKVIVLNLSKDIAKQRLMSRGEGREDDKEGVIAGRFKVYEDLTLPVVGYYKDRGDVVEVDATKGKEEVLEDVKNKII